eukprot:3804981-Rhodomonas_salina.1
MNSKSIFQFPDLSSRDLLNLKLVKVKSSFKSTRVHMRQGLRPALVLGLSGRSRSCSEPVLFLPFPLPGPVPGTRVPGTCTRVPGHTCTARSVYRPGGTTLRNSNTA